MQDLDHPSGNDIAQKLQDLLASLGPNFGEREKIKALSESFEFLHSQVRYSFRCLADTLMNIGYSEFEAEKISQDIVLKPILFSLVPRILCADDHRLVTQPLLNESEDEHLYRTHISLMPEIIVYWFDQTIDDFNSREDLNRHDNHTLTPIEQIIQTGKETILTQPDFYLELLLSCADLFQAEENPDSTDNIFYKLLHPTLQQVNLAGGDVSILLRLISDVITNEQRATELFRAKETISPDQIIPSYPDLLLSKGLINYKGDTFGNIDQETAYAIISNQGLLLVVYTSLVFSGQFEPGMGLVEMLQDSAMTIDMLLQFSALVRITDDLGDMGDDLKHQVPNILSLGQEAKNQFMLFSRIEDIKILNLILNENVNGLPATKEKIQMILLEFYNKLTTLSHYELNPSLARAVNAVMFAAFINAQLNDVDATNAASQLLTGAD